MAFIPTHLGKCQRLLVETYSRCPAAGSAIATNEVSLTPDQPLAIPATTNPLFLTLDVERSMAGKLQSLILVPSMLTVHLSVSGMGSSKNYRAVLPILKTSVLVNRRVWCRHAGGNPQLASNERRAKHGRFLRFLFKRAIPWRSRLRSRARWWSIIGCLASKNNYDGGRTK